MKLIIDIPDKEWEEWKNGLGIIHTKPLTEALEKAKPLQAELEEIKAEIREWYWQADKQKLSEDACVVDAMTDLFIRTINEHISELKGE